MASTLIPPQWFHPPLPNLPLATLFDIRCNPVVPSHPSPGSSSYTFHLRGLCPCPFCANSNADSVPVNPCSCADSDTESVPATPWFEVSPKSVANWAGKIVLAAKTRNGSEFLLSLLRGGREEDIAAIHAEVVGDVLGMISSDMATSVFCKLVEVCDDGKAMALVGRVTADGGWPMKKLISKCNTPEQIRKVAGAIKPHAGKLMESEKGNDIIRLLSLQKQLVQDVADSSKTANGYLQVNRLLDSSNGEFTKCLLDIILANALDLSKDRFGNFVIQHVLENTQAQIKIRLMRELKGSYTELSLQKYGSHVVERCLDGGAVNRELLDARVNIIRELIDSPIVLKVMKDEFGNYVMKAVVRAAAKPRTTPLFREVAAVVDQHLQDLHEDYYGKNVADTLRKVRLGDSH